MPENKTHEKFMSRALALAKKGEGLVSPNPLVGAVLVKKGEIIGSGWHRGSGLAHAEIEALEDCRRRGNSPRGATMYVSLAPCARRYKGKKTGPCCEAIIESGVSEVVIGCDDPNPKSGDAREALKRKGVSVTSGVLGERCEALNEIFFKNAARELPFTILKLSASVDGKIATHSGDSKWIGNTAQRKAAHVLRRRCDSVLVGVETVIKDDPSLDVRLVGAARQPMPVVADTDLRTPLSAKLLAREGVLIAARHRANGKKAKALERAGAKIIKVRKGGAGGVCLKDLMKKLFALGIRSVLIEGGGKIAASAIREKIVDKMVFFYSPLIIGGDGADMVAGPGADAVRGARRVRIERVAKMSGTIVVEAYPEF